MNPSSEYKKWLDSPGLSPDERQELLDISQDKKEIESRFFAPLSFGTAGLRGIMGVGLHRMNIHVIRHATQAFAEIILQSGTGHKTVAICHDCRNNSRLFAKECASVLAANGIHVRLFEDMRPTPELSFGIRKYGCVAGINVTASHNTKEYNGYKVYWSDGGQLPPNEASQVADRMAVLDIFNDIKRIPFDEAVAEGFVEFLGSETDEAFLEMVLAQTSNSEIVTKVSDDMKVVYTPFHGAGYKLVPEALKRLGIKHLFTVSEQMVPDGNFPTVDSPNPEQPESFEYAEKLAREVEGDIIIGTDPDGDRIAVLVKKDGEYVHLSGHKTGALLLDYIIISKKRRGTLPSNPVALKSIVTTQMARQAAEFHGVLMIDTFTGFKFMAERKNEIEAAGLGHVIYSYEESYGYMIGDFVRDKDAVTAAVIITEMAAWYYSRGMTLLDGLDELSEKLGFFEEETINLVMPGVDGLRDMEKLMELLRKTPPSHISGVKIICLCDYLSGTEYRDKIDTKIELSGSNVLRFDLEDGVRIFIRPSGTEPKIKVYIHTKGNSREECFEKLGKYSAWAENLPKLVE